MKFHYDKNVDALYIRFNNQRYKESREVDDGVLLDVDRFGKIIGIEVLDASQKFPRAFKERMLHNRIPATFSITRSPL